MRAVAAIPALGLLGGTAFGLLAPDIPPVIALALLFACGAAAVVGWRVASTPLVAVSVAAAFCSGGALLSARAWRDAWRPTLRATFEEIAQAGRVQAASEGRRLPEDDEAFAIVTGVLRSDAAATATGISISVAVDDIDGRPASGGVILTVVGALAAGHLDEWRAGRRVRLPAQLRRPSRYLDPDVPDFERALARRGTTLVGSVKSGALVDVVARGGWADEAAAAVRAFVRRAIGHGVGRWSARSAAIVNAIVIGDRAGLDDEVEGRLQEAGTYHVIAISGGNIAILAGMLLAAFRMTGMLGRAAMLAAIAMLVVYARLVGGGASVDRATLMAVVYFGGRFVDQRSPPLNALAVVAACLVATRPLSMLDPAFVLTFGATLAILVMVPVVRAWTLPRPAIVPAGMLAASIATEVVLLPVGALLFSRVTFAGLALNFAAIPLMAVAQMAGMAVVPAALVSSPAAAACGFVAHLAAAGLIRTADLVRYVPAVTFRVAPPSVAVVAVYYAAVLGAWIVWRRATWHRLLPAIAAAAAIWIVIEPWAWLKARGDGRLHVTFVDVGQGDAAFVRFPRGTTMVVDAGGLSAASSFDMGDRVVAPVLRAAGVRRLDFIALTHGDPDHIGGMPSLVREFRPRDVWEGIPVPPFEPVRALQSIARDAGSRWSRVRLGDRWVLDEVEVLVRHPGEPDWERQRVRNDDSIVLELRWRDVSVLLTGDIGKAVERTLVRTIPPAPIRVVKIPHHGSLTSSAEEFVRALAPTVAVVSAGRSNHYGHPVPEVLDRYRGAGAEVFRTDRDGAVMFDTDGASLSVHTFTGREYFYEPPRTQ